jgi:hypothetical protein
MNFLKLMSLFLFGSEYSAENFALKPPQSLFTMLQRIAMSWNYTYKQVKERGATFLVRLRNTYILHIYRLMWNYDDDDDDDDDSNNK